MANSISNGENNTNQVVEDIKPEPTQDTVISYDNGVNKMAFYSKDIYNFINQLVDENAKIIDTDFNNPNNYFYVNQITPNEMASAILNMLKNYRIDDKELRDKYTVFVLHYYSSLDPRAVKYEDYLRTGLVDEMSESYSRALWKTKEQIRDLHMDDFVNFGTSDDFSDLGLDQSIDGLADGIKCFVNIDTYSKASDFLKEQINAHNNGKYTDEEIAETMVQDTIFHEVLHYISSKDGGNVSGFSYIKDGKKLNTGLNETVTEYMAQKRPNSLYSKIGVQASGYFEGVIFLRNLIKNKKINEANLLFSYFKNYISTLSSEINVSSSVPFGYGVEAGSDPFKVFVDGMEVLTNPKYNFLSRDKKLDLLYRMFELQKPYFKRIGG
jgi:hypothetical protein